MLALVFIPAAFSQPLGLPRGTTRLVAAPAPTVTILAAATGTLVRSQGGAFASIDLGRVSYFGNNSAPGDTSHTRSRSFVVSTRFALKVDCPGNSPFGRVNITMSRLDEAPSHAISIDGTALVFAAQTMAQSISCGSSGEHRLDVEIPVSTPSGPIGSTVAFVATLRR
ncbi:MAG: hypothetical protein ABSC93_03410 [Bryobacteraceae bacterium]